MKPIKFKEHNKVYAKSHSQSKGVPMKISDRIIERMPQKLKQYCNGVRFIEGVDKWGEAFAKTDKLSCDVHNEALKDVKQALSTITLEEVLGWLSVDEEKVKQLIIDSGYPNLMAEEKVSQQLTQALATSMKEWIGEANNNPKES